MRKNRESQRVDYEPPGREGRHGGGGYSVFSWSDLPRQSEQEGCQCSFMLSMREKPRTAKSVGLANHQHHLPIKAAD